MQNLTIDKSDNNVDIKNSPSKLTIDEIEKFYLLKKSDCSYFGLEYERISFDVKNNTAASYNQLFNIIKNFASILKWELIFDEDVLIGAKDNFGSSISLEPGLQIELSLAPKENIIDIQLEAEKYLKLLDDIAKIYDVKFLGYGINPVDTPQDITILDKKRYKIMNDYLPYCEKGELCPVMMRKTAGIQVNVDFKDKKDAYLKLLFFNLISPFMTALFANSPFENNTLTNNKTNRAYAWLFTGKNRCNFFYKEIFKGIFKRYDNIFKDYIKQILNVPMVYIERNGVNIPIKGEINFAEYMKSGYKGYFATLDDYILHQSLCFPDVRLKQYIEIRNHDSSDINHALCLCAFYKGLNSCEITDLIKEFNFIKIDDIDNLNKKIIKDGLDFMVNSNVSGWDVAARLFNVARKNLNSKERIYLLPVFQMLAKRKTQADIMLDYDICNISDLIEFLS